MSLSDNRSVGAHWGLVLVALSSIGVVGMAGVGIYSLLAHLRGVQPPETPSTANLDAFRQMEVELQQAKLSEKQKNDQLWEVNHQLAQVQQTLSAREQALTQAGQQIQALQAESASKTQEIANLNASRSQLAADRELLAICVADVDALLSSIERLNPLSAPGQLYNLFNSFSLRQGSCNQATVLAPKVIDRSLAN